MLTDTEVDMLVCLLIQEPFLVFYALLLMFRAFMPNLWSFWILFMPIKGPTYAYHGAVRIGGHSGEVERLHHELIGVNVACVLLV